jgi:hypothetical protein
VDDPRAGCPAHLDVPVGLARLYLLREVLALGPGAGSLARLAVEPDFRVGDGPKAQALRPDPGEDLDIGRFVVGQLPTLTLLGVRAPLLLCLSFRHFPDTAFLALRACELASATL